MQEGRSQGQTRSAYLTREIALTAYGPRCAAASSRGAGSGPPVQSLTSPRRLVGGLRVHAARFGNAAERFAGIGGTVRQGEVAERHDADQPFALVEHRQAANLDVRHVLRDL